MDLAVDGGPAPTTPPSGKGPLIGLFLSNENTVGPAIDLLALVLREASRDRRYEIIVEGQIELRDSAIAVQPSVFLD